MPTRIDHIGIACRDLEATAAYYASVHGLAVAHTETNEEQGVREAMLRVNGTDDGHATWIQLLQPIREDCAVAAWLAKNGEGVHHIAFGTPDVAADAEEIRGKGVRVLYDAPRHGTFDSAINFLHPKDCHGVLTELVTAAPDAPSGPNPPDSAPESGA